MVKSQKIFGLNTLRFLAFTSVFLAHATPYGRVANIRVTFFFVLSSFLLTYLALKEIQKTAHFSRTQFFIRRGLRIYPLYYLMVGFSFYILPWLAGKQGYSITLPEKPWMYFTFLSNFERSDHLFALQYFWAIAVEEQFYILFLLLSVFFKRWIYGVSLTLFLLFIAGVIIGMQLDWHLYSNPIFHFASFGTGILMAQLYFKNRVPSTKYLLSALTLSVILMYLFFNTDAIRPFRNIPTSFMFGSMILLAIRVFENPAWQKTILFQWTEEAGRYTYGLYVFSGFVITFTGYFLPIKQPVLFLIVEFALLFTLAFLSYHLYEKWFLKLKRFYRPVVSNEQKEQRNSNELISSI